MSEAEELREKLVREVSRKVGNRTKLLYALAIAMDVLSNSIDQSIRSIGNGSVFNQHRKQLFGKFADCAKAVDSWYEKFAEPSVVEALDGNWREYEGYKQDANEILRVLMMYLNATRTNVDYAKVNNILIDMQPEAEEEKIFSTPEIERFSFIAKNRENT